MAKPNFTPTTNLTRGYAAALTSAVILATTAIFIRYLTQTYHLPALILAFWRDVIVTLTMLVALLIIRPQFIKISRKHLPYLLIYGFVLAVFNSLWTLSVAVNGAAISTVLVYCSAAFTAILGWWILKERLDWGKGVAVLLGLGGCFLVAEAYNPGAWTSNLLGIVVGILSGLLYAIYSLMGRSASQRGLSPWTTLLYTFAGASVWLLLFNLFSNGVIPGAAVKPADLWWLGSSLPAWGILFILAAGPTLLGFGMYNVSLSLLPSSIANLIVTLEPAFTAVMAYLLLGERLTGIQILGSLMILGGVVFLRIHEGQLARRTREQIVIEQPL